MLSRLSSARVALRRLFVSPEERIGIAVLAMAFLLVGVDAAAAHEYKIGAIEIGHPWSRATPPGAKVAGGYLTVTNDGDTPDKLVSATVEIAGRAEIHEMSVEDGVMKMRQVEGGLDIPAHGTVTFDPNGLHLMLLDLKGPLVRGTNVHGSLTFEKAGTVEVDYVVDAIGANPKPMKHDGGDAMPGMKMDH
ncbi:copper chaperone PCu(A)C [Mesorhizobium sp. BR1-1-16]|uniref:copper chaperone PCu(A)C n=1 Tax=Mesorhizobium sp. BR1-1-16 TaxID=2876653 RepID=UPI001CCEAEC8|nr:copper chaperone PCu(A)C [Mesorhizobium sp. BR1-1-16]MBZ9934702.1 copper chaperone PCu(A)C [Mesorhizobium sp. BR1-1-16]